MDELRRQLSEVAARLSQEIDRLRARFDEWRAERRARSAARSAARDDDFDDFGEDAYRDFDGPPSRRSGRRGAQRPVDEDAVVVATSEDDVASVVGRIDIAEAPEVVLIVRRDARVLRRPSAWPHIAAQVRQRGIGLQVVSPRGDVRAHARANGLRAARTPGGLRPKTIYVRSLDRTVTLPRMPWGRLVRGGMIVVAFGAIGIVGCYRVPSAVVTVHPDSEEIGVSGTARPNALVDESDLETETILVSTIRRQLFTVVTTTTTGETEVGDEHGVLQVTFTNAGDTVMEVPRLTRLLTEDGIAYITDEALDVPPGETAAVDATSELPGEPANVPAGALVQIASVVPPEITIAGSTAGSGGTNRLTAAVAQADVDRVREIATEVLNRVAVGALQQTVTDEERGTLIPSSVTAAIFSEQPVQLLDEPSDIFIVEYVITASGLVVSPEQAAAYGELLVREQLPDGQALLPGSVNATVTPLDEGRVQVEALARVAELTEITDVANEITGMRPAGAASLLQDALDLETAPTIEVHPNFIPWLWLPRRAENIELVIAGPEAEEEPVEEDPAEEPVDETPAAGGGTEPVAGVGEDGAASDGDPAEEAEAVDAG